MAVPAPISYDRNKERIHHTNLLNQASLSLVQIAYELPDIAVEAAALGLNLQKSSGVANGGQNFLIVAHDTGILHITSTTQPILTHSW